MGWSDRNCSIFALSGSLNAAGPQYTIESQGSQEVSPPGGMTPHTMSQFRLRSTPTGGPSLHEPFSNGRRFLRHRLSVDRT